MAMSEFKQRLLLYELAKAGFPNAAYNPDSDRIQVQPGDGLPYINDAGDIGYGKEQDSFAMNVLRPLADRVNESAAAWGRSEKMPFEDLSQFRILAEYNNVMLAARDDTESGRGLLFVTWRYNPNRTGLDNGYYTEDYNDAKENFAARSGLVSELKLFLPEHAAEIAASIEYRINNDDKLTDSAEYTLKTIVESLKEAYPKLNSEKEETVTATKDTNLHRYMDVDLELYLGMIADKVIIHYPDDWETDKKLLNKAALCDDAEEKRLIWHVCSTGTHLEKERDVFVRDNPAFLNMTGYRRNVPDMFGYVVEVTGCKGGTVRGNIFEVGDYEKYAEHICEKALRLDKVSLTYSGDWGVNAGKTITVSRKEFDNDRHSLMSESGSVINTRFLPADESELNELLRRERARRMALPIAGTKELLQKMADRLNEIRKPPEKEGLNSQKPKSLAEKLQAANEKAKSQETKDNGMKPLKRDERG